MKWIFLDVMPSILRFSPSVSKKFSNVIHNSLVSILSGICDLFGKATAFVGGDVGLIPICGALEVWQWTFGSRTVWLVNKSADYSQFLINSFIFIFLREVLKEIPFNFTNLWIKFIQFFYPNLLIHFLHFFHTQI